MDHSRNRIDNGMRNQHTFESVMSHNFFRSRITFWKLPLFKRGRALPPAPVACEFAPNSQYSEFHAEFAANSRCERIRSEFGEFKLNSLRICIPSRSGLPNLTTLAPSFVRDRGKDTSHGQGGRREGAHQSQGLGAGGGARGKEGKGDVGPRGQAGRGTGMRGEGQGKGQGKGGAAPRQPDVQAVRCIPPGIQQMPAHHAHHHHQPIYKINPDMGDLIPPPTPPDPPPAPPPARTAEPRTTPPPRHGSHGRNQRGWPPHQRRGGPARHQRSRRRGHKQSRHRGRWGPSVLLRPGATGPRTGMRSLTPLGAKASPW